MAPDPSGLRRLIAELKRRRVFRVGGVYLVVAWVAVEVTATVAPLLQLPEWTAALVLVLLLVGFPIAIVLAWAYQVTPVGIEATGPRRRADASAEASDAASDAVAAAAEPASGRDAVARFPVKTLAAAVVLGLAAGAVGWVVVAGGGGDEGAGTPAGERSAAGAAGAAADAARGRLRVETEPAGAAAALVPVVPVEGFTGREPVARGTTPFERALPAGDYLLRLEMERTTPLEIVVAVEPGAAAVVRRTLVTAGELTEGMVRVERGPSPVAEGERREVPAFLIDRHEITNDEYLAFVSAGGYERPELWPDTLLIRSERVAWAEAMAGFVDRTGMPGPRGWSGGLYPEGRGDHPVTEVSWYEAAAYARWAEKELPSWDQWWRAAHGDSARVFPWGADGGGIGGRANFRSEGTRPVGSYPLGASPVGALDMAGNVREWLRGAPAGAGDRDRAYTVGGSWRDPVYMADPSNAEALPPHYASPGVGFRCARPLR